MASKMTKEIVEKYSKKNKKDNSGVIAIVLVILIVLLGVGFTIFMINKNEISVVEKPQVTVSLSGEKTKNYTVKMSFEGKVNKLKDLSNDEYRQIVADAFNSVGEEKLSSSESTDYIKDAVKTKLSERFKADSDDFEITAIYIDEILASNYDHTEPQSSSKAADLANDFKFKK